MRKSFSKIIAIAFIGMIFISWSAGLFFIDGSALSTDLNTMQFGSITSQGISATPVMVNQNNILDKDDQTSGKIGFSQSYDWLGAAINDGATFSFPINYVTSSGILEIQFNYCIYGSLEPEYPSYFLADGAVGWFDSGHYDAYLQIDISGASETKSTTFQKTGLDGGVIYGLNVFPIPSGVSLETISYTAGGLTYYNNNYRIPFTGLAPKSDGSFTVKIYPRVSSGDWLYSGVMRCGLKIAEIRMWCNSDPVVTKFQQGTYTHNVADDFSLSFNGYVDYHNDIKYTGGSYAIIVDSNQKQTGTFTNVNPSIPNIQFNIGPSSSNQLAPGEHKIGCEMTKKGTTDIPSGSRPSTEYTINVNNDDPELSFLQQPSENQEFELGNQIVFTFTPHDHYQIERTWSISKGGTVLANGLWTSDQQVSTSISTAIAQLGIGSHILELRVSDGYIDPNFNPGLFTRFYTIQIVDTTAPSLVLETELETPRKDAPTIIVTSSDQSPFNIQLKVYAAEPSLIFNFEQIVGEPNKYQVVHSQDPLNPTVWDNNWNLMPDGFYTYEIIVKDVYNNQRVISGQLIKDSSPPVIILQNFYDGESWSAAKDIQVQVTDSSPITAVEFQNGFIAFQMEELSGEPSMYRLANLESFSSYFGGKPEGNINFNVRAEDSASNVRILPVLIIKDTISPTITVLVPEFVANSLMISASASEFVYWYYSIDSADFVEIPESFIIDISILDDGEHSIEIAGVDKAGNEDRYSQTFIKDTQMPVLDITNPESIHEHDFEIEITADEIVVLSLFIGSEPIPFDLESEGLLYTLTVSDTSLVYGSNVLTIKAIDRSGNLQTQQISIVKLTSQVLFTISAQNSFSTVKLLYDEISPSLTATITANSALLETFTVSVGETTLPLAEIDALWSILESGTYTIEFKTTSIYAQTYSRFLSIEKDISSPEITINTPVQDDFYDIEAPSYAISVTEPNIKRIWYTIVNSTQSMTRTITATSGSIDQSIWDNSLSQFVTIQFGVEDLCGNIGYTDVTIERTDWIGPRGNGIDLGLFLGMGPMTLLIMGAIFGAALGGTVIVQKRRRAIER